MYSAKNLLENGLRTTTEEINVPIEFLQSIYAEHVLSGSVFNGIKAESLVKTGIKEWQIITGSKAFTGDLWVHGFCDAREINGVDLQILDDTILKKSARDQVITGTIHVKSITAKA